MATQRHVLYTPLVSRSVAYPKHHNQSDISDIYMLAGATRGIFTNVALQARAPRMFVASLGICQTCACAPHDMFFCQATSLDMCV